MKSERDFELEVLARDLAPDIEKAYRHFGVNIEIKTGFVKNERILF